MIGVVALLSCASFSACGDSPEGAASSASVEPTTTLPMSPDMAVDRPIVKGQPFQVSFTGRLSELRGGYLYVQDMNGDALALLWDDSLVESPTGYELDPTRWEILDYGVMGDESSFVFPSELSAGSYLLCTANSAGGGCVAVSVTAT